MKIERIELIEINLPLITSFETSFGRTFERRIILVKVFSEGLIGWGECTVGEHPFYNHESTESAWSVIRDYVGPMVMGREIDAPPQVPSMLMRIRGNRMAIGAVESAIWDLEARRLGLPLWQLLGGTQRVITCGVSIGLYDTDRELLGKIETEVAAGYQRIKLKIKPGRDEQMVKAVRKEHPAITFSVDANSAYSFADVEMLRRLDDYNLLMIEQPLANDDIIDHAELQRLLKTPICLDESIETARDARQALKVGACRIINIKLGRVGGHAEARIIHNMCQERQVPVWCGGMLESGIGRAHNIAMSTLPGFSLPGDVSASKRYWAEDVITPPVEVSDHGTIVVPVKPGIGFDIDERRIGDLASRREVIVNNQF